MVGFSKSYKEPFVCNFLGLSSSADVPKHVTSSDLHVIVDIHPPTARARTVRLRDGGTEGGREDGSPLNGYKLVVQNSSRNSDAKSKLNVFHQAVSFGTHIVSHC